MGHPLSKLSKNLAQVAEEPVALRQMVMTLLAGFACLALLLAAAGIYSVLSYVVTSRTREIGLRMALGAKRGQVVRMILSGGVRMALAGTAAGVVCLLGMSRLLASQLFGVQATDIMTFTLVTLVLVVTMLLACYIPARRAAKIDPMVALRNE
jgi:putative ABC transport system permease protein